jgi:hypothetical protein
MEVFMNTAVASHEKDKVKTINVRVHTTSGNYPAQGQEKVPVTEPVQEILSRAASKLELVGTTDWIVRIGDKVVPASSTYQQLDQHGDVKLDWGANEGGGGRI